MMLPEQKTEERKEPGSGRAGTGLFHLRCRIEYANDVLEGVARVLDSSARSDVGNSSSGVVVTPGTGQATWTGFAPRVIIGSAQSAA